MKLNTCASQGPPRSSSVICTLQGAFAILLDSESEICEQFRSIGPVFYFTHHVSDESHTAFPVVVSLELPISILSSHASNSGGSSLSPYRLEGRVSL